MNTDRNLVFEAYIERVRDGQGSHVWEVTVCQNGEIIATFRDYSRKAVEATTLAQFPSVDIEPA